MAKMECVVPILYSTDVSRSLAYYVDKLGFKKNWDWESPPTFASVGKDKVEIFFCLDGQGKPGTWLSIFVDDLEGLHAEISAKGAKIKAGPEKQEWGTKEMLVEDPDGHIIRFSQNIED